MSNLINLTEIWQIVIAVSSAIITIGGAIGIIMTAYHKSKEPNKKQNERLDNLEKEVDKINHRLRTGDIRMTNIEQSMKNTDRVIIESLQALTSHAIDGNNIDELKSSKKSLDTYLRERI